MLHDVTVHDRCSLFCAPDNLTAIESKNEDEVGLARDPRAKTLPAFRGIERLPAFADVALRFRVLVATRQQVLPNWFH